MTGISDLAAEIREASRRIEQGDFKFAKRLDQIERSLRSCF
jgi:hypothetical protein